MGLPRKTYPAIFFASAATLGFEVLLVRVFSIALWYHFAFMVVSIAMLGVAVSGVMLAVIRRNGSQQGGRGAFAFLALTWSIVLGYLAALRIPFDPLKLSWDPLQILNISLYYVCLAPPFFLVGLIVARALSSHGRSAGSVYGSDLAGAALGVVVAVALQWRLPPGQAIFVMAALALPGAFILGGGITQAATALSLVALLGCAGAHPAWMEPGMSPYKELPSMLQYPGTQHLSTHYGPDARVDLFRGPGLRNAPGLSLVFRYPVPGQTGLAVDGGAISTIPPSSRDPDGLFLDFVPSAAAYLLRQPKEVLLLNPRRGVPLRLAQRHDAPRILQVEESISVDRVLRGMIAPSSPGATESRRVGVAQGILHDAEESFDLIHVSLAGTVMPSSGHGFEDYRFTLEAVGTYLEHLRRDGMLAVDIYLLPPYRTELRLLATAADALATLGVDRPADHVAALRSVETLTILVSRSALEQPELDVLRDFAASRMFHVVWPPADDTAPPPAGGHRDDPLRSSFAPLLGSEGTRQRFIEGYVFDIAPVSNDRPFFFNHLRLTRIGETFELVGRKWEFFVHEGYITPFILVQITLLGTVLVLLPAVLLTRRGPVDAAPAGSVLSYFALLGIAYMFVELALIQHLILVLETPTRALALTLCTLLASSGAGSVLGAGDSSRRLAAVTLAAGIASAISALALSIVTDAMMGTPLALRSFLAVLAVASVGFFMGIPFPSAVRVLSSADDRLIPWAWALNGFFSVLGPVIAIMVAARFGYSRVLILGSAAYLGASLLSLRFRSSPIIGTKATPPS